MVLDLNALAQSGATAIVTAMATGAWTQVRTRISRLFGDGDPADEQDLADELDEASTRLAGDDSTERAREVEAEVRGALRARLRHNPDLVAAFEALLADLGTAVPAAQPGTVVQRARADRGGIVVQAGRDATTSGPGGR